MIAQKLNCFLRPCLLVAALGMVLVLLPSQLQAQIDGGGGVIDGGGGGVIDGGGGGGVVDGGGGGATVGDGGGGGVDLDGAATLDLGGSGEDNRNQGFVGATAPGVTENTFVGAASQTFGALADDATFGGGVNDGTPSSIPSGAGGGGGGGLGGGAGGFAGTAGGSVIRSGLRTRLRPAFAAPIVSPRATENNFYNNLSRQPTAQSLIGRYQVTIENRTATVSGVVNTQADADRLIRQLRLQPGIYGIVNQLQIIR